MNFNELCEKQRKTDIKENIYATLIFFVPIDAIIILCYLSSMNAFYLISAYFVTFIIVAFSIYSIIDCKTRKYTIESYSFKWEEQKNVYFLYAQGVGTHEIRTSYIKILTLTKIKKHTWMYYSDELNIKPTEVTGKKETVKEICWRIVLSNNLETYLVEQEYKED